MIAILANSRIDQKRLTGKNQIILCKQAQKPRLHFSANSGIRSDSIGEKCWVMAAIVTGHPMRGNSLSEKSVTKTVIRA